jgi:signal transduction histidine kinase
MILVAVTMVIVRLRREVRLKNARLQENMAIKEKLISLILHDLKTPIYFHSLLLNQLVESDSFKNETSRQLFMDLKNSSDAVLQFTKEFLTWYSSQRDGFRVMKTAFDHRAVVEDLFLVYKDIAARKHLELLYTGEGIGNLFTDRNILTIILRNLLDNAIKYTDAGKVMLIFERRGAHDVITVSDTGYGMPEEKIRELEALSSITFGYRFIFTMAEKIGAHIQVTSRLGSGTSVKIILPSEQDTP